MDHWIRRHGGKDRCAALSLGAVLALLAGSASALPMEGTSSGTFVDAELGSGEKIRDEGTSRLRWGRWGHAGGFQLLSFRGSRVEADSGEAFSLGTLRHLSARSPLGDGIGSVDLLIEMALTSPAGSDEQVAFSLGLTYAPDAGGSLESALLADVGDLSFSIDGVEYRLELLGFQETSNRGAFVFFSRQLSSAQLMARITPSASAAIPNPEPDAALLFLVSLGVAGARLRRRRR